MLSRALKRAVKEGSSPEPFAMCMGLGLKLSRNAEARWPAAERTDAPARAFLVVPRSFPD